MATEFISEPIRPWKGTGDPLAMSRGEPGLPAGFDWRAQRARVAERLDAWKTTSPESGRRGNEVYLRRHYFRLRMESGAVWVVYFVRQTPRSGSARQRWFLFSIEPDSRAPDAPPPTA